jgi:hypothetical protein
VSIFCDHWNEDRDWPAPRSDDMGDAKDARQNVEVLRESFDPALSTRTNVLIELQKMAYVRGSGKMNQDVDHQRADLLLLALINDPGITAAFAAIEKWYE